MRFFYVFCFLWYVTSLTSQNNTTEWLKRDSLAKKLVADSLHTYRFKVFRPYAAIDNRNSFIANRPANVNGFQVGFILKEYHTIGLGTYRLSRLNPRKAPVTKNLRLNHLEYLTLFYEYMLVNRRYLEVDIPLEAGIGLYGSNKLDSLGSILQKEINRAFWPLGAGTKVIVKPVRWIGLSLMGGYRYVFEKNQFLNFNGSYYAFGIWIDLRQVYRDIKYYGFIKRRYRKAIQNV